MADGDANSRDVIQAAAAEEFREFGFHGARVNRIASRAGLNKQLIYYYFGSKRGLYDQVLKGAASRLKLDPRARRTLPAGAGERLRALLEHALAEAAGAPDVVRAAVLDRTNPAAADPILEMVAEFAREISRGQGLGHYRDDADPELAGRQAAMLVLGWAMTAHMFGQETADRGAWVRAVADTLTRSLSW